MIKKHRKGVERVMGHMVTSVIQKDQEFCFRMNSPLALTWEGLLFLEKLMLFF